MPDEREKVNKTTTISHIAYTTGMGETSKATYKIVND